VLASCPRGGQLAILEEKKDSRLLTFRLRALAPNRATHRDNRRHYRRFIREGGGIPRHFRAFTLRPLSAITSECTAQRGGNR